MPVDPQLFLAFCLASALLIFIPGPNISLIVANAVGHGTRYGLLSVAGTASAQVIQLAIVCLGLGSLMLVLSQWFEWLRWLGVAYLVFLGVRAWLTAAGVDGEMPAPSRRRVYWQAFLVAMTNPKVLLFYAAFFPQFIDPGRPALAQMIVLSVAFLVIAVAIDGGYALAAGRVRPWLTDRRRAFWKNRIAGTLLLGAAAGLAAARRT